MSPSKNDYLNEDALSLSTSKFRKKCFEFRINLIKDLWFRFQVVLLIGFLVLLAPMLSIVIIHQQYFNVLSHYQLNHADRPPFSMA